MANGLKLIQRKHVGWYMNGTMGLSNTVSGGGGKLVLKTNKRKKHMHI